MSKTLRLDAELVRRGLAPSRGEARRAIESGIVMVGGMPATKPATRVSPDVSIALSEPPRPFVSRGGEKLEGALTRLDVAVRDRRWLDVGASTGGFTDCLLHRGAAAVAAVDVGYGQLDWSLRGDDRVVVLERTNARELERADLPWIPDGAVADVSFISLRLILPALVRVCDPHADMVLLVKPQFEVGRDKVGDRGVVRDPEEWKGAITSVVDAGAELGLGLAGATWSEPVGPAGNREFFVHLRPGATFGSAAVDAAVGSAP